MSPISIVPEILGSAREIECEPVFRKQEMRLGGTLTGRAGSPKQQRKP